MMTFWRIHPGHKAPETVLDERTWKSSAWVGDFWVRCGECNGHGDLVRYDGDDRYTERCEACGGRGENEDVRRGVSAMPSVEALAEYMVERHANVAGDWLLEIEGDVSEDADHDADAGAVLILPRRIVSVRRIQSTEEIA